MRPTPPAVEPTTEQHRPPRPHLAEKAPPALLAAFPRPIGLPLPPFGAPVGRAWLDANGLGDGEVSSRHVVFSRSGPRISVQDCDSRNGTWIGGERLTGSASVPLEDGAILRLGRTIFVFRTAVASLEPAKALGGLIGPWGLSGVRKAIGGLHARGARNVLIEGETGTGKELVAHIVRTALRRMDKPFTAVNVASIASGVFDAQLFGWKKGAFSGSAEGGAGVFASSDHGTVFLDEIGELPLDLQPKLLRLLENRESLPVGASRPVTVDVAVIGATNRSLDALVDEGKFRRDLLARFDQRISIPPLRDRAEDVYAIAAATHASRHPPLDPAAVEIEAVERLLLHDWPSNVRELATLLAQREEPAALCLRDMRLALGGSARPLRQGLTRAAIERVLAGTDQNQSEAARLLGISRGKLRRLLAETA